jgi:hypothetical protein
MSEPNDWNAKVIAEFRANEGRVGGNFEGAPVLLVHSRGRKTGRENVAPMMYLADEPDDATVYVFASRAGAPTHPVGSGVNETTAASGSSVRPLKCITSVQQAPVGGWAGYAMNDSTSTCAISPSGPV